MEELSRLELLVGSEAVDKLKNKRVAIFGVGGVGGYVCEALARSGVGAFDLIDSDTVAPSNINRQIIALHSTLDKPKVMVMKERMMDINPEVKVDTHECFYLPETAENFDFSSYDYVVDAVDTVTAKIDIIMRCKEAGVPVISAMGAGNKLDPTRFRVADIYKTSVCPLCKVMRRELKKRNVDHLKVVYSDEEPIKPGSHDIQMNADQDNAAPLNGKRLKIAPGSSAFTPSVCGLVIASEVFKDLINS
ncbi:MAG: tRNA threonylcarbamoyladenosine dehydratase [Butyrivibrio sp.]|nr:tRNA threonylcarbamoyladenosine dehydratase [Butyrivibrio sp.]